MSVNDRGESVFEGVRAKATESHKSRKYLDRSYENLYRIEQVVRNAMIRNEIELCCDVGFPVLHPPLPPFL